jgi:long-chain acyl-CoA synthetase
MLRHTLVNHFLEFSAARVPDKIALVHHGQRLKYADIERMSNNLASALLKCNIEKGDRVAIFMDNSVEAVVSLFGVLKAGAAFMIINHSTKAEKLAYLLNNSRAKVLISQSTRVDVIRDVNSPFLEAVILAGYYGLPDNSAIKEFNIPCISYDEIVTSGAAKPIAAKCIDLDLASIIYTSGSTGNPKGVMLSHLNMLSAAHSITTYLENVEQDVIMNVLPISFDYGLYQILMGFRIGGTVILEKSFAYPVQIIQAMEEERVTGFPGVPTIFALLLRIKNLDAYDLGSLRYLTNTAAALPVSHIRRLRELFPQAKLFSMYGLTECKRVSYLPPEELDRRPESVGKGMPNEEIYIIDESGERVGPGEVGELVIRGSNVMLGYWESPEETFKYLKQGRYPGERVLHTGDLFKMDNEGFIYFVARKDDIIKCKGEKVSPKEVENVLYKLDGILEAAVVGVPDEIFGQAIKAYVSLEHGVQLREKEILKHCADHLENFMIPRYIEIRNSLPKTETGKISKKELKCVAG